LYEVRQEFNGFTLLELQLITGRRHQIRRHLAKADLPIVGDERYGPKRPKRIHGFPGRLWLHAWKLTIAEKVIEAPLPEALETHLTILNEGPSEAP
jgi:23S rRNA-/tRNA-specific pseudouridylate synthase